MKPKAPKTPTERAERPVGRPKEGGEREGGFRYITKTNLVALVAYRPLGALGVDAGVMVTHGVMLSYCPNFSDVYDRGQSFLANELQLSDRTIRKHIARLEEVGAIERVRNERFAGLSAYRLLPLPVQKFHNRNCSWVWPGKKEEGE